jgi:ketosteroid isomerase-like protein
MKMVACIVLLNALIPQSPSAPIDVVRQRYAVLQAALQKGDFVAVSAMYHADASLELKTPTGLDRVRGHESIAEQWQRVARAGAAQFEFTVVAADLKDGTLLEKGTFLFSTKAGPPFGRGSYVGTWTKEGNVWKLLRHEVTVEGVGR